MGIRVIALLVLVGACVKVPGANRPEVVNNGGTWTCQQIVEQCDSTCQAVTCLDECTSHGTPEAQQQHNTVVGCGQRNFCTNEDCMRANCGTEMDGCAGDPQAAPPADQPPAQGDQPPAAPPAGDPQPQ